jgi:membrane-bound metal-dependent hydrolase YbcI (DUF457 family)
MAGFRTHVTVSSGLGVAVGAAAVNPLGYSPEAGFLAAAVTAVGGMLPDLDSDSGIPLRETFSLAAAVTPLVLLPRLHQINLSPEGIVAGCVIAYILVRYVGANTVRFLSVHRGMFHSIPAMLISGLAVYLAYDSPNRNVRILLAAGVMLGFFSHLLLDELYSVDFNGLTLKLNQFAGSAIKFVSPSFTATLVCYLLLGSLLWLAYAEFGHLPSEPFAWPRSN